MGMIETVRRVSDTIWEIPLSAKQGMRVPARIYATEKLVHEMDEGRTMSRTKARKQWRGEKLQRELEARGIYVRTTSWGGLAEEAGGAYKNR